MSYLFFKIYSSSIWSFKGRHQNTIQRITKADKRLLVSLQNSGILLVCKSMQRFAKVAYSLQKSVNWIGNTSWMSSPRMTFNLTCRKGVTELQNLTNLRLSSFAECHQMQQKNFDVSPNRALIELLLGCWW